MRCITAACLIAAVASADVLSLARFDGSSADFKWVEENDPVMGGVSTNCTFTKDGDEPVRAARLLPKRLQQLYPETGSYKQSVTRRTLIQGIQRVETKTSGQEANEIPF